ncbi:putative extracellular matrix protein [Golovinomyces cichoracearum]|uniref:Putative extracellular matrix protein n=1 Tax=Golovinomyces cichoracearum TaxID=62708 RepID=A0A420IN71_9PEZI|nr:putative extracellular matrix protein [Golovinomyces cichoracearum]
MFSRLALFSALFALAQSAKLTNTADSFNGVTAGKPMTITWAEASGPVTLLLKEGSSTNLRTVSTIASGQTGNSFTWTPDTTLPSDTYAIQINDASGVNYSVQFPIKGATTQPSSSSAVLAPSSSAPYPSSAPYSTGYSAPPSSYVSSCSSNMTSTISSPAHVTSSYISAIPTGYTNYTSSRAPSATISAPETVPSDTNTATSVTSPVALLMLVLVAVVMMQ